METSDGFIPIVSIFYAVFHPTEGTKIVHQVPEHSISSIHRKSPKSYTGNKDAHNALGNGINNQRNDNDDNKDDDDKDGQDDDINHMTDEDQSISLFNFDTVKNYVIPKPQLCNKLISFKINKFKVVGYPVNIENPEYSRNSFNFNFCFVFPYDLGDVTPYESAIQRMGKMFKVLEEQSFILSKLDKDNSFFKKNNVNNGTNISASVSASNNNKINIGIDLNSYHTSSTSNQNPTTTPPVSQHPNSVINTPGHSRAKKISLSSIESLINQLYQDLNNYSECCIPLDSSNSVDIKLFPILPPPVNIKAYQVPIATVKLNSLVDVNWDPTMIKILPYINGINSVKKISELANANYMLTKQCIQHLMHYKCIDIIDIFQFSNIYAPTNHIGNFLRYGGKMAEDCQSYVITSDVDIDSPNYTPINNNSPYNTLTPNNASSVLNRPTPILTNNGSISPFSRHSPLLSRSPRSLAMLNGISGEESSSSGGAATAGSAVGGINGSATRITVDIKVPSKAKLFYLYRSLNQGQTVKEWYVQHRKLLVNIDVRRFINFGVIRGIIYRVHSFPIMNSFTRLLESNEYEKYSKFVDLVKKKNEGDRKGNGNNSSSNTRTPKIINDKDSRLLKTRVNEQTLKTTKSGRKVSFNRSVGRRPHSLLPDIISESDKDDDNYSDTEKSRRRKKTNGDRRRRSTSSLKKNQLDMREDDNENALDISDDEEEYEGSNGQISEQGTTIDGLDDSISDRNSGSDRDEEEGNDDDDDDDDEYDDNDSDEEEELDSDELEEEKNMINLIKLLKGYQNFDSINTELQTSRQDIESLIDSLGSYSVVNS
ncbi:nitrogen permease regulator 2-domain-containing protein [Scheffersomyces coipomensis]|uniref:nitrogen permease regulator 2-domain-containing protein n=1 Tax=Scheffersomyces coipomensis TaxID=1788519 RepID=UPI00315CC638